MLLIFHLWKHPKTDVDASWWFTDAFRRDKKGKLAWKTGSKQYIEKPEKDKAKSHKGHKNWKIL